MGKTQCVTIPLEEYKELLLKEKPADSDKELLERMMTIIRGHIEYSEYDRSYYTTDIGDHLKVDDGGECVAEIMKMLKYVDFERYMEIWNGVMTGKRNKDAMEAKIAQMNEAREIRSQQ